MRNIPIAHILPFQNTNTATGNISTGTVLTRIYETPFTILEFKENAYTECV